MQFDNRAPLAIEELILLAPIREAYERQAFPDSF